MSNADKLAEALEALLFEHEHGPDFITPKDAKCPVEEAKKALASYRASKDVADDELLYDFETVKEAAKDYISTLNHPNDETQKSIISEAIQSAEKAIARLQALSNPRTDNELAFALKLATINLTNPEDAGILQMIEQVIVHLETPPNPWVKIGDAENMLNGSDGPFDVWAYETNHADCVPSDCGTGFYHGSDEDYIPFEEVTHVRHPINPPKD